MCSNPQFQINQQLKFLSLYSFSPITSYITIDKIEFSEKKPATLRARTEVGNAKRIRALEPPGCRGCGPVNGIKIIGIFKGCILENQHGGPGKGNGTLQKWQFVGIYVRFPGCKLTLPKTKKKKLRPAFLWMKLEDEGRVLEGT